MKPHQRRPVIDRPYSYWSTVDKRWRLLAHAEVVGDCYPRQKMVLERKIARKAAMKQLVVRKDKRAQAKRASHKQLALELERSLLDDGA